MRGVEILRPGSFAEALTLLDTDDPMVRPMSGGTALILMMKSGVFQPTRLVSLAGVEVDYRAIEETPDGGLRIGGLATLTALGRSDAVRRVAPVIAAAMPRLSNVRVRNVACVGGALAHADPHMDLPPVLAALGALVNVEGPQGVRSVPVEAFFLGYYETVLEQGELVASVTVPPQAGWRSIYRKCTTRAAEDWPALGVAVSLRETGGKVEAARVMVSAATEKLTRVDVAEKALVGVPLDAATIAEAADRAADTVETIDDAQGAAAYKTELLRVHLRRALTAIATGEEGA